MRYTLNVLRLPLLALALLVGAPAANAWTTHIDCEGGTVGQKVAQNSSSFTSTFTNTVYSKDQVGTGSQSCKMGATGGTDGWGNWGAIYSFPSKLSAGSKLWIRLSMFVPNGFNYTGSPWLKFMRVHTASPTNNNKGYLDLYINPLNGTVWDPLKNANVVAPFTFYYEGKADVRTLGTRPTNNIALGKWESYEINYVLDTQSQDNGGKGHIRIWKNNVLLADLSDQTTLADSTTYAESFFLFTYWNGNVPTTQSLYIDDVIVTTDTPAARDAAGNPFIGGTVPTAAVTVAPAPPTQVSAQ